MLMLPSPEMTLQFRLDEIERSEQTLVAQGHCVFALVKDVKYWAECGIYTARDLDEMLDAEVERERRKSQMSAYDDTIDDRSFEEMEAEFESDCVKMRADYEAHLRDTDYYKATPFFAETAFFRDCAAHQDGWV